MVFSPVSTTKKGNFKIRRTTFTMAPSISTIITVALSGAIMLLLYKGRSLNTLLQDERSLATLSITERDNALERLRSDQESLAKNYRDLDTQKKQLSSDKDQLVKDVKSLQGSNQQLESQAQSDQIKIDELEDEVSTSLEMGESLKQELAALRTDHEAVESDLDVARNSINDAKHSESLAGEVLQEADVKIKELMEALKASEDKAAEAEVNRLDAVNKVAVVEAALKLEQDKTALLADEISKINSALKAAPIEAKPETAEQPGEPETMEKAAPIEAQPETAEQPGEPETKKDVQPEVIQPQENQVEEIKPEESQIVEPAEAIKVDVTAYDTDDTDGDTSEVESSFTSQSQPDGSSSVN